MDCVLVTALFFVRDQSNVRKEVGAGIVVIRIPERLSSAWLWWVAGSKGLSREHFAKILTAEFSRVNMIA